MVEDAYLHTGTTTRKAQPLPYKERDKLGWLQRPIPGDLVQTAARTGLAQATFFHTDCCTLPSHSQRTKRHCNNAKTTVARPKNHGTFSRHCLYCAQAYNTQAIDITPSQSFRNPLIPVQVRQKHHMKLPASWLGSGEVFCRRQLFKPALPFKVGSRTFGVCLIHQNHCA